MSGGACQHCGKALVVGKHATPGRKKFCDDACRHAYWSGRRTAIPSPTGTLYEACWDQNGLLAWRRQGEQEWQEPPGPPELVKACERQLAAYAAAGGDGQAWLREAEAEAERRRPKPLPPPPGIPAGTRGSG